MAGERERGRRGERNIAKEEIWKSAGVIDTFTCKQVLSMLKWR